MVNAILQVIHQKPKKSLDEITHDLCPVSWSGMVGW
jgi:hypothetical protein